MKGYTWKNEIIFVPVRIEEMLEETNKTPPIIGEVRVYKMADFNSLRRDSASTCVSATTPK